VGPKPFQEIHASVGSPKEVLQKIMREEPLDAQWMNQILARAQLKNDIYLVSELADDVVRKMMITPVHSIKEGLEKAFQVLGENAEIAVISEGPLVIPLLEE
jgi:nickel-dependent lactate racemase